MVLDYGGGQRINSLSKLGLSRWFRDQVEKLYNPNVPLARVTIVNRDQYTLRDENGEFTAVVTRKFIRSLDSTADLPCVGDWVCVEHFNFPEPSVITQVLNRKSFLRRKVLKKKADYQMIASNIDTVFFVEASNLEFSLKRLERYLAVAKEGGVEPVLVFTKIDLISENELKSIIEGIRDHEIDIKIMPISNKTSEGVEQIQNYMSPEKTYCLVGSSGVGKTTLINGFVGGAGLKTNTVSKTGEGRHTTVRRELLLLRNQAMLVDTPGMRGLTVETVEETSFDFDELVGQCKFSDCSHTKEPACAVLKAVEKGELNKNEYQKFINANKPYKISYAEKRSKKKNR